MTAWALAFGWNWLLVPVVIWLARGAWAARTKPYLQYVSHSIVGKQALVTVRRQEIWPPWRSLLETWLVPLDWPKKGWTDYAHREHDGKMVGIGHGATDLGNRLWGIVEVACTRDAETEELSK